jgi:hypothetical protein
MFRRGSRDSWNKDMVLTRPASGTVPEGDAGRELVRE